MSEAGEAEAEGHAWLIGVASVVFDIDQGQTLEGLYPQDVISEAEGRDVAFNSFPDSMSMELHAKSSIRDSTFFFRLRRQPADTARQGSGEQASSSAAAADAPSSHYHNHHQEYLYGFVYCRQRQDDRLKRGGEQKSLVLLSLFPFSQALSLVSHWAGPLYFNQGLPALQEVYQEVMQLPPPVLGSRQLFRIATTSIVVQVPDMLALPPPAPLEQASLLEGMTLEEALPSQESIQGTFSEVDCYTPLKGVLEKAWCIWELLVLAQPLMVAAPSPGECSGAVAALVGLITPLPYSADFRPYLTIHDATFADLLAHPVADNSNSLPRLLGVTNLYFLKALPGWVNVLSTGLKPAHATGSTAAKEPHTSRLAKLDQVVRRRAVGAQALLSSHQEALWTSHKPLTRPDKDLLERLLKPQKGDPPSRLASLASTNSTALRAHFRQLTAAFLEPFDSFMRPSPPPPGDEPLPAKDPLPLPPFSHADFLELLDKEHLLPAALLKRFNNKASCIQFYRRFLESPNFSSWFERRRGRAAVWQEAVWAQAAAERGQEFSEGGNDEVQLIDAFALVERKLEASISAASSAASQESNQQQLRRQLSRIFQRMPRDLQSCILSSPSRAALMHHPTQATRVPGQAVSLGSQEA